MQEVVIDIDKEIIEEVEGLLPEITAFLFDKSVNYVLSKSCVNKCLYT